MGERADRKPDTFRSCGTPRPERQSQNLDVGVESQRSRQGVKCSVCEAALSWPLGAEAPGSFRSITRFSLRRRSRNSSCWRAQGAGGLVQRCVLASQELDPENNVVCVLKSTVIHPDLETDGLLKVRVRWGKGFAGWFSWKRFIALPVLWGAGLGLILQPTLDILPV